MTNAELAILALVSEQPCYGYEIEQKIVQRGLRDWAEVSFSSIYFLLNKLEREGWINAHLEPAAGRGPARKVYEVTVSGREALVEGIYSALSTPRKATSGFLIGIGNIPGLPLQRVITALETYLKDLTTQADQIRDKWESQKPLPYFVDGQFEYTLVMIQAEIHWVEGFLSRVKQNQSWQPGTPGTPSNHK